MRRSHILVRRTRSASNAIPVSHRALILGARSPRLSTPRKSSTSSATKTRPSTFPPEQPPHLITASKSGPPPNGNEPEPTPEAESAAGVGESEVKDAAGAESRPGLPSGLDILWSPDVSREDTSAQQSAIPPQDIFDQIQTNFHLTLHPQTQHKAAYTTASGPPVEPTLALYCPIEGGDYILDAVVRELGHRNRADVVVIDAAQLAAGENGHFGKGA